MQHIDIRTIYHLAGFLYIIIPLAVWIVLWSQRALATHLWCGAGVLMAFAALLVSQRGVMSDFYSFTLANMFAYTAAVARIEALRLHLQQKSQHYLWLLLVLIPVGCYEWLRQTNGMHTFFGMVMITLLALMLGYYSLRLGREQQLHSANWIALFYLATAAIVVTMLLLQSQNALPIDLLYNNIYTLLLSLLIVIIAVWSNVFYVGIALEQTSRNRVEEALKLGRLEESQQLSNQLAQLDRQRSLGEMSASFGHELHQPLTAIETNAELALRKLPQLQPHELSTIEPLLQRVVTNTRRAVDIIARIRHFIKPSELQWIAVDMKKVVWEVMQLIEHDAKRKGVVFTLPVQASPIYVRGDAIQLSQVLLNIYRNAMDALQHVDQREIEVTVVHDNNRVITSVFDSGCGMSDEVLRQAGNPFFTTKPNGLGMGLTISRAIVSQHGGELVIRNGGSGGGCVELLLPVMETV